MRTILFSLALSFGLLTGPAFAQEPTSPAAATAAPVSEASLSAARDLTTAMLVDSGILPTAIQHVWNQYLPQLRQQYGSLPGVSEPRRQAAVAFLETVPAILNEEVNRVLPRIINDAAPDIAAVFTEQELTDIATFMRDARTRSLLTRMVTGNVAGLTNEELAFANEFSQSPAGRAMDAKGNQLTAALDRAMQSASQELQTTLMRRMFQGLCGALEEECPAPLRTMANAPT
ncbi:MAG: DUF2059 domain-containing protein [Hyphomonadaceae bacterium]